MLDRDVALLADVPSAQWNEVLRRQAIVDSYGRLTKPTGEDAERHAELLGLSLRSFYRLVRAYDLLKRGDRPALSRRGSHRHAPPALDRIVEETRRDLGAETPDRVVRLEIGRQCQAAGLSPPSQNAVRIRANESPIDLRIRLGRRCDLVLDICPLVLDVFEGSDTPEAATLSALLRAEDGALTAYVLTAGPPDASRLLALVHRAVPPRSGDVTLVATGAGAETLGTVAGTLCGTNIAFDAASSRGLQPGSAIGPALGHLMRRVPLAPRRKAPAEPEIAVPLDVARRVVAHLLARRTAP